MKGKLSDFLSIDQKSTLINSHQEKYLCHLEAFYKEIFFFLFLKIVRGYINSKKKLSRSFEIDYKAKSDL